jgi:LCP family protein required for cell wall assembly
MAEEVRATRRQRQGKPKRRVRWGRLILVVVVLLLLAGGAYGYNLYRHPGIDLLKPGNPVAFHDRFTVLLLGEGLVQNGNTDVTNPNAKDQTDTMMLLSINPTTDQASVLSVPRDSMVNIPGYGLNKINDANFLGGPQLAVKMVEQTLHVPVNYYVETTIFNFAKMVNDIGGLTVYVPFPMNYGNAKGKFSYLNIHLTKGYHHLNGYQVLEFVRFRNTALGDIGRIQEQQYVIGLIAKKVLSPGHITALPELITSAGKMITHTNLTTKQMIELGVLATHIHLFQVRYATLPGEGVTINGIDYWKLNQRLMPVLTHDILSDHLPRQQRALVHIQVLAGAGHAAAAQTLTTWLDKQGFDAYMGGVYSGTPYTQSVLQDYTGDKYLAAELAKAMGGPSAAIVKGNPYHTVPGLDVDIYVGTDFHLNPKVGF